MGCLRPCTHACRQPCAPVSISRPLSLGCTDWHHRSMAGVSADGDRRSYSLRDLGGAERACDGRSCAVPSSPNHCSRSCNRSCSKNCTKSCTKSFSRSFSKSDSKSCSIPVGPWGGKLPKSAGAAAQPSSTRVLRIGSSSSSSSRFSAARGFVAKLQRPPFHAPRHLHSWEEEGFCVGPPRQPGEDAEKERLCWPPSEPLPHPRSSTWLRSCEKGDTR